MITSPYIYHITNETFTFDVNGNFKYPANVTIPNTVIQIAGAATAFQGHMEIKTITFETGSVINTLLGGAFRGCVGLEEVRFQDVRAMNTAVFQNCTSLKEIELPASLTTMVNSTFSGCTALKKVVLNSVPASQAYTYTTSGNHFYNCVALEDVVLPDGWNVDLLLSNDTPYFTNLLTHDSIVAMIDALYDFSGGTAHTLTLGATNLSRLSNAEKAVATAKNWTLA